MPLTLEDIRTQLNSIDLPPSRENIVEESEISDLDDNNHGYVINHGLDVLSSHQCDQQWGKFNFQLLDFVKNFECSEEEREEMISGLFIEDAHWDWLVKSYLYKADEYDWFYLIVEDQVEAVCLIYHPKGSAIDEADIFYVEYVAVAPWNRNNPMQKQKFKGLGTILIKRAVQFSIDALGLRPGFSLHSLPSAEGYYRHLGMQDFPERQKERLKYFEMPEENALTFVEGV